MPRDDLFHRIATEEYERIDANIRAQGGVPDRAKMRYREGFHSNGMIMGVALAIHHPEWAAAAFREVLGELRDPPWAWDFFKRCAQEVVEQHPIPSHGMEGRGGTGGPMPRDGDTT